MDEFELIASLTRSLPTNKSVVVGSGDDCALLDFGLLAGLHYKFSKDRRSMGIGVRYFQGLTDVLKPTPGTQVNVAWQLVISIPVGTGKANGTNAAEKQPSK